MAEQRMNIKIFAEKLGVSTATISRAFGARGRISENTRKKILEAAEVMGYHANFHAKNLASRQSGSICFFYPELYTEEPDYFISEIVLGINRCLKKNRVFKVTPFDEKDKKILNSCKEQIMDGRVSAAIIIAGTPGAVILAQLADQLKIPYVLIGKTPEFTANVIDYDNAYGAMLAGKYFKDTNRKHPGYISGHQDQAKKSGFAAGYGTNLKNIIQIPGGVGFKSGAMAFDYLREKHPEVDCVLCANDILAIGFIKAASKYGVNIPKEIAVIGFDDTAIAKNYIPALSTVSLHLRQIGVTAVNMIEAQFDSGKKVANQILECDLIIREST